MLVVIDTNILVNAIKAANRHSKSMQLLDDVFHGVHTMCVSSAIIDEYSEVLSRPQLAISAKTASAVIQWIDKNAYHIEPRPSSPDLYPMNDEDDRIFFDVARSLSARLITRNYKDYPVHELITLIDEMY